jgi:pimeloyl-ACP methyl ester carboxylesterase
MRLAAGLPRSTISVVPEAGHAPHLENLDRTSTVILEFLAELDQDRHAGSGRGPNR